MRHRRPPWLILVLLAGVCCGIIYAVAALRAKRDTMANLLLRLPAEDAVVVYIDFDALRRAHVLGVFSFPAAEQEPEYRAFVTQTGFDYLRDLDSALVSFHRTGTYGLVRGRFDWQVLRQYTLSQGGECYNSLCRLQGSTPERKISFFPLRPTVMALAVGQDDSAAAALQNRRSSAISEVPGEPIWSIIPVAALRDESRMPSGTRGFARALQDAQRIALSLGPDGPRFRLRLDVTCRSAESAAALAAQLRGLTTRLRELIARENQTPNRRDLSGTLTTGSFEQKGQRVLGHWAVEREFLESLAGGAL